MTARPYREAARYYRARPPYSDELRPALAARLGWDGSGRLLDAGCGPGVLALQLAGSFAEVVGLDPEPAMLDQARLATPARLAGKARWIEGRAEQLSDLGLGSFRAVSMGQSFHRMDREAVAELIHASLDPGGAFVLVHHDPERPAPRSPGHPPIPHDLINEVLKRWLGHGWPAEPAGWERHEVVLARSSFGQPEGMKLPGRTDLVRSIDDVIDNYLSMSFAAPDLFGDRLPAFRADLARELASLTPTGYFWEWPGDTDVIIARKR